MNEILNKFIAAGLPVLPLSPTKEPIIYGHKFLDTTLPTTEDYAQITPDCRMFGLKCGNDQTKIEAIDFDLKNDPNKNDEKKCIWNRFNDIVDTSDLYVEKSPHGYHILYRLYEAETVEKSQKLAYCSGFIGAVIETRGRGGYCAVAPSDGYQTIIGDIFRLPIISSDRVDEIKSACRSLSDRPEKSVKKTTPSYYQRVFDCKHCDDVLQILTGDGWTIHRELPDRFYMCRPGKTKGVSATLFKTGVFYVFTSATEYNINTAYSPFSIIAKKTGLSYQDMERKVCDEIGEIYIKDLVTEILRNKNKLKSIDIILTIFDVVLKDMLKKGLFYRTDLTVYYFVNKKLLECSIKNEDFTNYICETYELSKTESYSKFIYEKIRVYAYNHSEYTTVHRHSYYNPETRTIYIDNFNGTMYMITSKDILGPIDNGIDGVLFLKSDAIPFEYIERTKDEIDFNEALFGDIKFNEDDYGISQEQYKKLLICWILCIFFGSKTRCLLYLVGQAGSGKTILAQKILTILFGHDKDKKILPEKEEDFNAAITNNKIIVWDNVDSNRDWLNEKSAICATGGSLTMRKLYETNVEHRVTPDVFMLFTSRQPPSRQDDVADRTIEIPIEKFKKHHAVEEIMRPVIENRNLLISIIMQTLKSALAINIDMKKETYTRIAYFEIFCRAVYPGIEMEETFKKIIGVQKAITDDSFNDVLRDYCESQETKIIIKNASEISKELVPFAKARACNRMNLTSKSIGHRLKKEYDFAKIEIRTLAGNKKEYVIEILIDRENAEPRTEW